MLVVGACWGLVNDDYAVNDRIQHVLDTVFGLTTFANYWSSSIHRGEKRSLAGQCRRDCTPAAGPTPPRRKQPIVWGTGKKVVCG